MQMVNMVTLINPCGSDLLSVIPTALCMADHEQSLGGGSRRKKFEYLRYGEVVVRRTISARVGGSGSGGRGRGVGKVHRTRCVAFEPCHGANISN